MLKRQRLDPLVIFKQKEPNMVASRVGAYTQTERSAVNDTEQRRKSTDLHRQASALMRDAWALGDRASAGQFLLFGYAVEMALRSFLLRRGISLKDLRLEFAGDLRGLSDKARGAGLELNEASADD